MKTKHLAQSISTWEVKTELARCSFLQSSIVRHCNWELCNTSALTTKPFLAFSTYSCPRSFTVYPFSTEQSPNSFTWHSKSFSISIQPTLPALFPTILLLEFSFRTKQIYLLLKRQAYSSLVAFGNGASIPPNLFHLVKSFPSSGTSSSSSSLTTSECIKNLYLYTNQLSNILNHSFGTHHIHSPY